MSNLTSGPATTNNWAALYERDEWVCVAGPADGWRVVKHFDGAVSYWDPSGQRVGYRETVGGAKRAAAAAAKREAGL